MLVEAPTGLCYATPEQVAGCQRRGDRSGERDPDARGGRDLVTVELKGLTHRCEKALGELLGVAEALHVLDADHEFIATKTGHRVLGAEVACQPVSDVERVTQVLREEGAIWNARERVVERPMR